jgi:hypothetical protein
VRKGVEKALGAGGLKPALLISVADCMPLVMLTGGGL